MSTATTNFVTLAKLSCELQRPVAALRQVVDREQIKPSLVLNDTQYFDGAAAELIAAAFREEKSREARQ